MAKKASKIFVNAKDSARVLFTEVLPYELPIIFSNQRLYNFAKSKKKIPTLVSSILLEERSFTIPFEYPILQGPGKTRGLYLIHPAHQLKFVSFYEEYSQVILSLCARSGFSLRRPSKIASYFYDKQYVSKDDALKTNTVDQEPDPFGEENKHSSSYFYYANYSHLYKFIDSQEWLELERHFSVAVKTDVSKCFPSIYTHTIAWAVKGKSFAKEHKDGFSFEARFDRLMQDINYKETNGIVIGPEFSRVFAEIIFQAIDLNIEKQLANEGIGSNDYAIRRFVDDYFIFAKSSELSKKIIRIVENSLKDYKLYLNEAKTETFTLPFITPQTISKTDVTNYLKSNIFFLLNVLKAKALKQELDIPRDIKNKLKAPYRYSLELIRELKIAVKKNNQDMSVVAGTALSHLTRSLFNLHKFFNPKIAESEVESLEDLQNILLVCIEVVFFFYPMDFRVRTTYLVAQFMLIVSRLVEFNPAIHEYLVTNIKSHIERLVRRLLFEKQGLEVLNLLTALREIYPEDNFDEELLIKLLNPHSDRAISSMSFKDVNYFEFVSFLFYCQNKKKYQTFKEALIESSKLKIIQGDLKQESEIAYLFFDFISCPWIPEKDRKELINTVHERMFNKLPEASELNHIFNYCCNFLGFIDWNMRIGIEKVLLKKELSPVY